MHEQRPTQNSVCPHIDTIERIIETASRLTISGTVDILFNIRSLTALWPLISPILALQPEAHIAILARPEFSAMLRRQADNITKITQNYNNYMHSWIVSNIGSNGDRNPIFSAFQAYLLKNTTSLLVHTHNKDTLDKLALFCHKLAQLPPAYNWLIGNYDLNDDVITAIKGVIKDTNVVNTLIDVADIIRPYAESFQDTRQPRIPEQQDRQVTATRKEATDSLKPDNHINILLEIFRQEAFVTSAVRFQSLHLYFALLQPIQAMIASHDAKRPTTTMSQIAAALASITPDGAYQTSLVRDFQLASADPLLPLDGDIHSLIATHIEYIHQLLTPLYNALATQEVFRKNIASYLAKTLLANPTETGHEETSSFAHLQPAQAAIEQLIYHILTDYTKVENQKGISHVLSIMPALFNKQMPRVVEIAIEAVANNADFRNHIIEDLTKEESLLHILMTEFSHLISLEDVLLNLPQLHSIYSTKEAIRQAIDDARASASIIDNVLLRLPQWNTICTKEAIRQAIDDARASPIEPSIIDDVLLNLPQLRELYTEEVIKQAIDAAKLSLTESSAIGAEQLKYATRYFGEQAIGHHKVLMQTDIKERFDMEQESLHMLKEDNREAIDEHEQKKIETQLALQPLRLEHYTKRRMAIILDEKLQLMQHVIKLRSGTNMILCGLDAAALQPTLQAIIAACTPDMENNPPLQMAISNTINWFISIADTDTDLTHLIKNLLDIIQLSPGLQTALQSNQALRDNICALAKDLLTVVNLDTGEDVINHTTIHWPPIHNLLNTIFSSNLSHNLSEQAKSHLINTLSFFHQEEPSLDDFYRNVLTLVKDSPPLQEALKDQALPSAVIDVVLDVIKPSLTASHIQEDGMRTMMQILIPMMTSELHDHKIEAIIQTLSFFHQKVPSLNDFSRDVLAIIKDTTALENKELKSALIEEMTKVIRPSSTKSNIQVENLSPVITSNLNADTIETIIQTLNSFHQEEPSLDDFYRNVLTLVKDSPPLQEALKDQALLPAVINVVLDVIRPSLTASYIQEDGMKVMMHALIPVIANDLSDDKIETIIQTLSFFHQDDPSLDDFFQNTLDIVCSLPAITDPALLSAISQVTMDTIRPHIIEKKMDPAPIHQIIELILPLAAHEVKEDKTLIMPIRKLLGFFTGEKIADHEVSIYAFLSNAIDILEKNTQFTEDTQLSQEIAKIMPAIMPSALQIIFALDAQRLQYLLHDTPGRKQLRSLLQDCEGSVWQRYVVAPCKAMRLTSQLLFLRQNNKSIVYTLMIMIILFMALHLIPSLSVSKVLLSSIMVAGSALLMTIFNNETVAEVMHNHKMAINTTLVILGSVAIGVGLSLLGMSMTIVTPLILTVVSLIGIAFALNNPYIAPISHTTKVHSKDAFIGHQPGITATVPASEQSPLLATKPGL
jgi:hypothetical protein